MMFKKVIFGLILLFSICFLVLFYFSTLFDFDAMEGRSNEAHANVKWAFKSGASFSGVTDYLLLQAYDHLRGEPQLIVRGNFWLDKNGYLEVIDLKPASHKGEKCLNFSVENFKLLCSINDTASAPVCDSSFLTQKNILSATPNLNEIVEKYDEIKDFYKSFPTNQKNGERYKGDEIPQPLKKYTQTNVNTEISCWVEKADKDISKPNLFECHDVFHKCKASQAIKIVK